jgi:hypothetical protein
MALVTNDSRDSVTYTGAGNSATVGPFRLLGGLYALFHYSTGTASSQLNMLCPDGSTYIPVAPAFTSTTTPVEDFSLPAGTYEIVVGASGGTQQGGLVRVPYREA